jgi:hypothetical protein
MFLSSLLCNTNGAVDRTRALVTRELKELHLLVAGEAAQTELVAGSFPRANLAQDHQRCCILQFNGRSKESAHELGTCRKTRCCPAAIFMQPHHHISLQLAMAQRIDSESQAAVRRHLLQMLG